MESDVAVICRKCKKNVLISELRKDEGQWVCNKCFEKLHYLNELQKQPSKIISLTEGATSPPPSSGTARRPYFCISCGYRFAREHFSHEEVCPYCGESGNVHRTNI